MISQNLVELLRYWEKRRPYFNLVVLLIITIGWMVRSDVPNTKTSTETLVSAGIWIVGSNLCYCAGWGIELLFIYYFKRKKTSKSMWLSKDNRQIMFWLGLLVTIIWTFINIPFILGF